jgi:hypothetical protein
MLKETFSRISKKIVYITLFPILLQACGPSLEDKTYGLFYKYCKNIDSTQMRQVIQVFGENQFNNWCSCASHTTEETIPINYFLLIF